MKKFIVSIAKFVVFSSIFYITLLFLWVKFTPATFQPNVSYILGSYGHLHARLSEVKQFDEVDILFLGSSHAYRGFDTRIFLENGYKTFNLGSSSQTPVQTEVLLHRYLENLNPKLVIYEVYPSTFESDGVESAIELVSNDQNDFQTLKMAAKIKNIKVFNTLIPLYSYASLLR